MATQSTQNSYQSLADILWATAEGAVYGGEEGALKALGKEAFDRLGFKIPGVTQTPRKIDTTPVDYAAGQTVKDGYVYDKDGNKLREFGAVLQEGGQAVNIPGLGQIELREGKIYRDGKESFSVDQIYQAVSNDRKSPTATGSSGGDAAVIMGNALAQAGLIDLAGEAEASGYRKGMQIADRGLRKQLDKLQPWYDLGMQARGRLEGYIASGMYDPGSFQGVTDLHMDPGYRFRLDEGMRQLNQGMAARGKFLSGEQLRAAQDYSQNMASNEYARAYGRAVEDYNLERARLGDIYNTLSGQSGVGLNTGNQQSGYIGQNIGYGVRGAEGIGQSDAMRYLNQARNLDTTTTDMMRLGAAYQLAQGNPVVQQTTATSAGASRTPVNSQQTATSPRQVGQKVPMSTPTVTSSPGDSSWKGVPYPYPGGQAGPTPVMGPDGNVFLVMPGEQMYPQPVQPAPAPAGRQWPRSMYDDVSLSGLMAGFRGQ